MTIEERCEAITERVDKLAQDYPDGVPKNNGRRHDHVS